MQALEPLLTGVVSGLASEHRIRYEHGPPASLSQHGSSKFGAIAQLGERLNGIQEVTGSIPVSSTQNPEAFLWFSVCANKEL